MHMSAHCCFFGNISYEISSGHSEAWTIFINVIVKKKMCFFPPKFYLRDKEAKTEVSSMVHSFQWPQSHGSWSWELALSLLPLGSALAGSWDQEPFWTQTQALQCVHRPVSGFCNDSYSSGQQQCQWEPLDEVTCRYQVPAFLREF